jgi:uncharacterized protein (TIGR03067 family)
MDGGEMISTMLFVVLPFLGEAGTQGKERALQQLEGSWIRESMEYEGTQLDRVDPEPQLYYKVKGHTLLCMTNDTIVFQCKLAIDATTTPKQITLIGRERQVQGIYALDGDLLLVSVSETGDSKRPKGFNSAKEEKITVYIFRRK